MSNYIVDGSDLTSVANAIRAKSGGSGQLAFPAGFVSAISSLPSPGPLPSGYAELEYIESDGNCYIDLNYKPAPSTIVLLDYMSLKNSGESFQCQLGVTSAASATAGPQFFVFLSSSNVTNISVSNNTGAINNGVTINKNDRRMYLLSSTKATITDGSTTNEYTPYGSSGIPLSSTIQYPIYLFARNQANANANAKAKGRVYSLIILSSYGIERNLVPAMRESDEECGLYDIEHDVFYTNSGSGTLSGELTTSAALNQLLGGA